MSNRPERYVDQIFDEVLKTFSKPDTLTTSLQDWRKGRRAEIQEVNGHVVDVLKKHGKPAPVKTSHQVGARHRERQIASPAVERRVADAKE